MWVYITKSAYCEGMKSGSLYIVHEWELYDLKKVNNKNRE